LSDILTFAEYSGKDIFMKTDHLSKFEKILLIITSPIIILAMAVILFNSAITKYIAGKYDEKYTGRKITMDWAYVNPLTGYIYFSNLKIHELKSDSVFFSTDGIGVNISILKLFSGTFEISKLTLIHPRGAIIQNRKVLNINDLIDKFSSKGKSDTLNSPFHFNILNITINEGEFYYIDRQIPINYSIKGVNIASKGKRWDTDTITAKFALLPGIGTGDMNGEITINLKNKDYRLAVVSHKFNLSIIEQYLKELTNYGSFSANIDADIMSNGNLDDLEDVSTSGFLAINDLHFGKNPEEDYASFEKLVLAIRDMSPKDKIYSYDSISLIHPYLKYERYDYLDNVQKIFGKNGANISAVKSDPSRFNLVLEIANYIKVVSKNFLRSNYKIDHLRIYNADIKFNDFSTSEKFALELDPLTVIADSVDKKHKRVNISLESVFRPYGNLSAALSINPKDSTDFDLQYHFQRFPVSLFNPYIISSTSFTLDRGTLEFNGSWNVRNGAIKSINHLVIIDPRLTKRIRNKDTKWIPAPLIMAFIRERGNVIDYEIPITGNLKDPKFHISDVIFDLLGNIFTKPPATPYIIQVKNVETEIEKSLTLKWAMRQTRLLPVQEKFVEKMADFLIKNPDASITFYPQNYAIKEKEYILFFEAKKKYFLGINNKNAPSFNAEDSAKVGNMSVKDSLFVLYLNRHLKDSLIFTIQEKCSMIIDSSFINTKFNQLTTERETALNEYFKKRGVDKRIKISQGEYVIPYNGFSFYKIEYHGEFPESLIKAYKEMNELNNEAPRKKYKQERKINQSRL
jgi:hypothetical protein